MLNVSDIEFMHDAQDEIYTLRERPITVIYLDKQRDPVSGIITGEEEVPRETSAVVTEITSVAGANADRQMAGGIVFEQGDVKVDIKIERISDIATKIERIEYDDESYELLSLDKKGIGRRNRYEIIGRVIA